MISVVIPALNEERLIGQCLESLRNQDCQGQYEVVVVDNGSTDRTAEIALSFGARVVLCRQRGVGHARQAGAQAAYGDIIVQADADTIYPRDWLSRIERHFSSHTEAVAVAGAFIYQTPPWWAKIEYFLRILFNLLPVWLLGRPYIISGANFAFRKSALLKVGGYDHNAYSSDQYNISTRLSRVGKIIYDQRLKVITSNRAVQKPLLAIAVAFVIHIVRFLENALEVFGGMLQKWFVGVRLPSPRRTLAVLLPVALIAVLGYGYFAPASPVFGNVYYKGTPPDGEKVIALTFDDGPNEPYTSQILDILDRFDIKATFFVIGYNVALYPATARRMRYKGHVLGNHSYSHLANHALTTVGIKDMRLAQQVIFDITGVKPHLYRPPHGRKTPWELQAVQKEGMIEVLWSNSTNELSGKSPVQLAQQIIKKSKPGRIILLHDGYGLNHNDAKSDKSLTVAILPLIIEQLQAEGYRFVTVPELLKVPAYILTSE